jgi:hypothetical protein
MNLLRHGDSPTFQCEPAFPHDLTLHYFDGQRHNTLGASPTCRPGKGFSIIVVGIKT